jgi:hypothetical protein
LGFRDKNIKNVSLNCSRYRTLLIGDSFTEGIGYPIEKTFAGLLTNYFVSKNVDVLNAGVRSYSPKLFYLKIKYLLDIGFKFDKLMVFTDISDIQDEYEYKDFVPGTEPCFWKKVDQFFTIHSLSYNTCKLLRKKWCNLHPSEYELERSQWTLKDTPWKEEGIQLALVNMNKLFELCKLHNIPMSIVIYPWPYQIVNHDINSMQEKIWSRFCAARGIKFINLFPYFINNTPAQDVLSRYYIHGDSHWNKQGHELAFKAIKESLKEHK